MPSSILSFSTHLERECHLPEDVLADYLKWLPSLVTLAITLFYFFHGIYLQYCGVCFVLFFSCSLSVCPN